MLLDRLCRVSALGALGIGLVLGCSVDHRTLELGPSYAGFWIIAGAPDDTEAPNGGMAGGAGRAGAAGAQAGGPAGGASNAGNSTGGAGGTAGSMSSAGSGGASPLVDGCPDLNLNGKADCKETLVKNAGFASDTKEWLADDSASLAWSPENPLSDTPSGSALVTGLGVSDSDGLGLSAATQCVDTTAALRIEALASAFVKGGQGEGGGSLSVFFYPMSACSGSPAGAPLLVASTSIDTWQTLKTAQPIPEGTKSARVRLAVAKPFRTAKFEVLFDNILIRTP